MAEIAFVFPYSILSGGKKTAPPDWIDSFEADLTHTSHLWPGVAPGGMGIMTLCSTLSLQTVTTISYSCFPPATALLMSQPPFLLKSGGRVFRADLYFPRVHPSLRYGLIGNDTSNWFHIFTRYNSAAGGIVLFCTLFTDDFTA